MNLLEETYQKNLDYLYSFIDYSLTRNLQYSPETFNLKNMFALVELIGNPQKKYPIIHVAGTKGKGSTAAMIVSILMAADYRTGFYLSPHLIDFAERIQVNNQPIPHGAFNQLIDDIKPHVEKIGRSTTFEITTALAFLAFARQKVDAAVVEVGLGGRVDSTNVVDPVLSVITSLSMDHMNVLGDSLEKIAAEKSGIIKPGIPLISAAQQPNALEVLEETAQKKGSALTIVGRDIFPRLVKHSLEGQWFEVQFPGEKLNNHGSNAELTGNLQNSAQDFYIPLLGRHQVDNASTAIAAAMQLRQSGFDISDTAIQTGLSSVIWPCRLEILQKDPLLVVDSAHNRDSAKKLRQALEDYFPGKSVTMIFGASEDKDISGMFAELLPICSKLILTRSTHPRAADLDTLIKSARSYPCAVITADTVEIALEFSLKPGDSDSVVLAAGSLFVAAAVKSAWETHFQAKSTLKDSES